MKTNQGARNPKKRRPGRSTKQNTNTKPDRQTDWSTDRPLMRAWRGPSPFKLRRVKRARQRSEMGELGFSKSCCRNTSMSCCCCCSIAKTHVPLEKRRERPLVATDGDSSPSYFPEGFWGHIITLLREHYATFERTLCHFWGFVKLQKSHSRSSWINYMSLSSL